MRKRPLALIGALSLGGSLLIGGLATAPAFAAEAGNVDIRVELDLLNPDGTSQDAGPAVFEVVNVPIVAGPELTSANLVSNPSGWCGSLTVDVDLDAKTITVKPDYVCGFTDVKLWVSSPAFEGSMTLVSDDLLQPDDECEGEGGCDECGEGGCEEPCEEDGCGPTGEPGPTGTPGFVAGSGMGKVFSAARIAPMAAPGSTSTLSWSFAAPQLTANWNVPQNEGYATEFLSGTTVFSFAAAPTPPEKVDTALAGNDGWVFLAAGALAALGAIALGGTLVLRRREG